MWHCGEHTAKPQSASWRRFLVYIARPAVDCGLHVAGFLKLLCLCTCAWGSEKTSFLMSDSLTLGSQRRQSRPPALYASDLPQKLFGTAHLRTSWCTCCLESIRNPHGLNFEPGTLGKSESRKVEIRRDYDSLRGFYMVSRTVPPNPYDRTGFGRIHDHTAVGA